MFHAHFVYGSASWFPRGANHSNKMDGGIVAFAGGGSNYRSDASRVVERNFYVGIYFIFDRNKRIEEIAIPEGKIRDNDFY